MKLYIVVFPTDDNPNIEPNFVLGMRGKPKVLAMFIRQYGANGSVKTENSKPEDDP